MASLHGFTLKKIVNYRGHEGEPLAQADIHYNGKKIGFWRMGDFGGEDDLSGIDSYNLPKMYYDIIRTKWQNPLQEEEEFKNYVFSDESVASSFFAHLLELIDIEKEFKKVLKTGFQAMVQVSTNYYRTSFKIAPKYDLENIEEMVMKQFDKAYPKLADQKKKIVVYKDLSQFVVE